MRRKSILLILAFAALVLIAVQPSLAQSGAVWNGQYYNNGFLIGNPTFQRQDSAITFDWGAGSPGSGIGNDGFSVRWGTDVNLPAGTYRFWALADDNIRITINFGFQPLIDTFARPAVGQIVSADVTLPGGSTHIQVDYQENGGNAFAYVTWANAATNPSAPNWGVPSQPPISSGAWTAQYYGNPSLSGSPALIQSENNPTRSWGAGSPAGNIPADNFSARWTTTQSVSGGSYRISVKADDGVRIYVNGSLVINEWHGATGQTYTADVSLPAGQHNFLIEYYEGGGDAFIEYNIVQIGGGVPPQNPPPINTGGIWLAYYFNNTNLSGSPTAIVSENSPTRNWGSGSPLPNIGADNFSVRWTSSQTLNAGTYRIAVKADDGVRVYVNGILVINEWHGATGLTYTADLPLPAGQHSFIVEFYEATGAAFLEFSLGSAGQSAPPPANTGASATVTAYRLNVRNQPNAISGSILLKINQGETYPIVGRNSDSTWWQLNVNGTVGWVFGRFVNVSNAGNVPVASGDSGGGQVSPTGYFVTASSTVNIRSGPSTATGILGRLPQNQTAAVVGRNASASWWQISYNGLTGWVSANFAIIQSGANLTNIPIRG